MVWLALFLSAFALRMYRLGQQPLSWDEGWSIGLSSLPWSEIHRITALDVHPPLYYDLLKLWLTLGRNELLLRFLSVIAGMVSIPLAYATARAWMRTAGNRDRDEQTGLFTAAVATFSPFLLYYSQVVRMFSLCVMLTLLAVHSLLKVADRGEIRASVVFVLSAVAAVYTFYYSAFVLAAAFLYILLLRPRRRLALCLSAAVAVLLYAPWLLYAVPPMLERVGSRTGFALGAADLLRFLTDGMYGLVFAYGAGWIPVYVVLLLLLTAVLVAWRRGESLRCLLLPLLAVVLTLLAVSVGAKAHMFAARYLIAASPFLAFFIAWAVGVLWQRAKWLGMLGLLALVVSTLPTLTGYVYPKSYEVSGAFDPQADYRFLTDKADPDDLVVFNVLSLAGLYERFRDPARDADWSYVLRWDPVVEPLEAALTGRVLPATRSHQRLWFVLYKGTVAANYALKEWLDQYLFPAQGQWQEDTLYVQYLSPTAETVRADQQMVFDGKIWLKAAEFTPRTQSDGPVTVRLTWEVEEPVSQNYKVFAHLYSTEGRLVAQHDAVPQNELRPTWSWQPGEQVVDNHGLWVPEDISAPLRLAVGLYDAETNSRLALPGGADYAEVGIVEVVSRAR